MSAIRRIGACVAVSGILLSCGVVVPPARGQCLVAKLTASDMARGDGFGANDIDGDYIVVGAPGNDDACPSDPDCNSGSAYIFKRIDPGMPWDARDDTWIEQAKLLAPDAEQGDGFGARVAISGDYALITAPEDDDANPADPGCDSGAVYVFRRDGESWSFDAKLTAADGACGDRYAWEIGFDGDLAVVGAAAHQPSDPNTGGGAVYVFRRAVGTWNLESKLFAESETLEFLGNQLAAHNNIIAARVSDFGDGDIKVRVYRHIKGAWTFEASLEAIDPQAGDSFADHIATDGTVIVVGTTWHEPLPNAATVNSPVDFTSGSAHVYRWNGAGWDPEAKLHPSDGQYGDAFGTSVSADSGQIVVGATRHGGLGLGSDTGAAYFFNYNGVSWQEQAKLLPLDIDQGDRLGWTVSQRYPFISVGARSSDDACPEDTSCNSGSVYVYWLGATAECVPIPALSTVGLVFFAAILLFAGSTLIRRRARAGRLRADLHDEERLPTKFGTQITGSSDTMRYTGAPCWQVRP